MSVPKIVVRPSKMDLIMACAGSVRMQAPYKFEDSDAAIRGRGLHDAMALLFQTGTAAWSKIRTNENLHPDDVAVLPEVFRMGLSQKPNDAACQIIVEEPLDCKAVGIESGKPDLIFLSLAHKVGVIIDWKFGKRPVENVSTNKQLLTYACALMAKHPDLEAIEVVIIQPFGDKPEDWVSSHTYTRDELRQHAKVLRDAALAALQPNAPCIAGPHCFSLFCNARKDGETSAPKGQRGAPITACSTYVEYQARIAAGKAEEKRIATEEVTRPAPGSVVIDSTQLTLEQAATPGLEVTVSPDAPITGPFYIATAETIAAANAQRDFALSLRVTDATSADVAGRTRIELGKRSKLVQENYEVLNAPIVALQRKMRERVKEVTGPQDEAAEHLKKQIESYVDSENKKKAAALAEQEKKRRDAEAAQRQAEAETARKQAEALAEQRAAEEALQRASLLKTKAAREKAEAEARASQQRAAEAQRQAAEEEEKRLQAIRAQDQAEAEAQAALQPTEKIVGFRTEEKQDYVIPDFSKIPPALLEVVLSPNDKVIKQMIKTGGLTEAKHGTWITITRGTKALGSR